MQEKIKGWIGKRTYLRIKIENGKSGQKIKIRSENRKSGQKMKIRSETRKSSQKPENQVRQLCTGARENPGAP